MNKSASEVVDTTGGEPTHESGSSNELGKRWLRGILAAAESEDPIIDDVIGVIVIDGVAVPIFAPDGRFDSARGFRDGPQYDARTIRASGTEFCSVGDYIRKSPLLEEMARSNLGRLLTDKFIPLSIYDAKETPDPSFVLFQCYPPEAPQVTRSGFIGAREAGKDVPAVISIGNNKYIVEIKGSGHAGGGFEPYNKRLFETIALGGLPWKDAEREFDNLTRASQAGLTPVLPIALAHFEMTPDAIKQLGDLGAVIKLSPSNIRLSHRNTTGAVPIESANDTMLVIYKLLDNFLNKFLQSADMPVFISPASHLENYLVSYESEGFAISETDFEDFRDFGSKDLPFVHAQTATFIDTRATIRHYFINFSRLEGFDETTMRPQVTDCIQEKLSQHGVVVDLNGCDSMVAIADGLWEQWLLRLDYRARCQQNYAPTTLYDFFVDNLDKARRIGKKFNNPNERLAQLDSILDECVEAEALDELANYGKGYMYVHNSAGLTNAERRAYLDGIYTAQNLLYDQIISSGAVTENYRHKITQIMQLSRENYEISMRIFAVLQFFTDYVESELDYIARLRKMDITDLDEYEYLLMQIRSNLEIVNNSNDSIGGVVFYWEKMHQYLNQIIQLAESVFKNSQK